MPLAFTQEDFLVYLFNTTRLHSTTGGYVFTRVCVNRGYLPWLVEGGYLPWPAEGYLPWTGVGVPTLDRGGVPTLDGGYLS